MHICALLFTQPPIALPRCTPLLQAVPAAVRAEALSRISQGSGLVLVCTDAAARGLDVPDVTHVVQVRRCLDGFGLLSWSGLHVTETRCTKPTLLERGHGACDSKICNWQRSLRSCGLMSRTACQPPNPSLRALLPARPTLRTQPSTFCTAWAAPRAPARQGASPHSTLLRQPRWWMPFGTTLQQVGGCPHASLAGSVGWAWVAGVWGNLSRIQRAAGPNHRFFAVTSQARLMRTCPAHPALPCRPASGGRVQPQALVPQEVPEVRARLFAAA